MQLHESNCLDFIDHVEITIWFIKKELENCSLQCTMQPESIIVVPMYTTYLIVCLPQGVKQGLQIHSSIETLNKVL